MALQRPPRIAIGPEPDATFGQAVTAGGGVVVPVDTDPDALVWTAMPEGFPDALPASVRWVQIPSAGVEQWLARGIVKAHPQVRWTCGAGAYSATVAEHALTLLLAGVRALPQHLAARAWTPEAFSGHIGTLRGSTVAIIGAGGVGRALIPMLIPFGATALAVNRSGRPVPGAAETIPVDRIDEIWPVADHVVLAAPATAATEHMIGADEFAAMKPSSWLINVARGTLVDTDALVVALCDGTIAGAGLDVVDPEPLPDGHPLWSLTNAMITPHDANPATVWVPAYADRVTENVTRFASGVDLLAEIDIGAGY